MYQILLTYVHKCARTHCKHARARFIAITRVYDSYARIYAQILMKFDKYDHKIVNDHHIKFHEDMSFRCGDICKTILVFFNHWFSMFFWYFRIYAPPKPSKMDNYWMIVEFFETRSQNGPISVKWKHQSQLIFCILRFSHKHSTFDTLKKHPVVWCNKWTAPNMPSSFLNVLVSQAFLQ